MEVAGGLFFRGSDGFNWQNTYPDATNGMGIWPFLHFEGIGKSYHTGPGSIWDIYVGYQTN